MELLGSWVDKGPRLAALLDAAGVQIVRRDGVLYSNNPVLAHQIAATVDAAAEAKAEAKAAVAARRYDAEIAGTTVHGLPVQTDRASQALVTGAALAASLDPDYTVKWKTAAGFVDLSAAQIIGIAQAIRAHVQACFDREAELGTAIDAGEPYDITTGWPG